MPVNIIDTLKPKNGLSFPVVEAIDVFVEDYENLADAISHFATDVMIEAINTVLSDKANASDVNTAVANLQGQIDQIVISASAESVVAPEVAQARVDADGTEYSTLKARLDAEQHKVDYIESLFPAKAYPIVFTHNSIANGEIGNENPARLASELIKLEEGDKFSIKTGYKFEIFRYDNSGNYLSNPVAWTEGSTGEFTCSSVYGSYKHRIYIAADDNSNIELEDVGFAFTFSNYPDVPKSIAEIITPIDTALTSILDVLPKEKHNISFDNKSFSTVTGEIGNDNPKRLLSELITTAEGDTFTIASGFEFEILRFDTDGNYVSNPVAWTSGTSFTFTSQSEAYNRYKHRIYLRKVNDNDCVASELNFVGTFANYQQEELADIETLIDDKIAGISAAQIDDTITSSTTTWSSTKILSEMPNVNSVNIRDDNALSLWEDGNIIIVSGEPAPSTSWLFPVSIRTKSFLSSEIYYVCSDRGWFIRVFEYTKEGVFVRLIEDGNVPSMFLSPQMKYKIQLIKEGANPENPSTYISTADDSFSHAHFYKVTGAPSAWYKYNNFSGFKNPSYYKGLQSAYDLNKDVTYSQLIAKFDELVQNRSSYVTKTDLGTASDTQHLYLYDFNPSQVSLDAHSTLIASEAEAVADIPKIIITVCQHGSEKDAAFGMYYFLKDMLEKWDENETLNYIRHHVRLLIIPCCNPYGWDNNVNWNANGVNTNRNFDYNWVQSGEPFESEYSGAAPFDQPETQIIRDFIYQNADAFHLIDFHTTGNTAPAINEVAWIAFHETSDLYYNRITNCARYLMKEFSAQTIKNYNLAYDEETLLGWIIGGQGSGVLKNWASSLNIIGITLETTGEIYGESSTHTPRAMKYSSELIGNWLETVIADYSNGI
jgi:hypothetical protein